eukprot:XP_001700482.1 predicted protein [Chlamydomonas reinhardtii]
MHIVYRKDTQLRASAESSDQNDEDAFTNDQPSQRSTDCLACPGLPRARLKLAPNPRRGPRTLLDRDRTLVATQKRQPTWSSREPVRTGNLPRMCTEEVEGEIVISSVTQNRLTGSALAAGVAWSGREEGDGEIVCIEWTKQVSKHLVSGGPETWLGYWLEAFQKKCCTRATTVNHPPRKPGDKLWVLHSKAGW